MLIIKYIVKFKNSNFQQITLFLLFAEDCVVNFEIKNIEDKFFFWKSWHWLNMNCKNIKIEYYPYFSIYFKTLRILFIFVTIDHPYPTLPYPTLPLPYPPPPPPPQERSPPALDDFLYICDDAYSRNELLEMEICILKSLDFDICMPLSYRFLRRYAKVDFLFNITLN